jgi:hypothetical protein
VFRIHYLLVWIRIRILDPDPAIFLLDLQDASKNYFFNTIFSAYYFLKVHLHLFSKIKSQKESQHSRNQGFSYYFCMLIEGSGSIPLTGGSGSGRPKNMWIRNRNTAWYRQYRYRYHQLIFMCELAVLLLSSHLLYLDQGISDPYNLRLRVSGVL